MSANAYSYPIDDGASKVLYGSSAHRKFQRDGAVWDLTHAVDFNCEGGTPVKAALDGEVVEVVDSVTKNYVGVEPPAESVMAWRETDGNYVVIRHERGEFSVYAHLAHKEVTVAEGDRVKTGDIIGYSGNTGWSAKPHLHFMVFSLPKPEPAKDIESLEVAWKGEGL